MRGSFADEERKTGYLTVFDCWLSFFDGIQDQIGLSLSVWMIDLNVECVTIAKKV